MERCSLFFLLTTLLLLFSSSSLLLTQSQLLPIVRPCTGSDELETYIVHVQQPHNKKLVGAEDREKYYRSFLPPASPKGEQRMVFSYSHAITGFAAKLNASELNAMASKPGFLHAQRDEELSLDTTHSADFLGLHPDRCFWKDSNLGEGVIIGVLDTGVFPSHPSFSDAGMPFPPPKWRGSCDLDVHFCNDKLIGARGFRHGCRESPLDNQGHGTHTASTAAGSFVHYASVLGQASGTAAGMAPRAHLAVYKVCYNKCRLSDIIAGIDQAIGDGVDVISMSISGTARPFYDDSLAIGALAAVEQGIFVSVSAGNKGPSEGSVRNDAPWMLTVGASTMDRSIQAMVKLGNGEVFDGESVYQPENFPSTLLPLVYPGANRAARVKTCTDGSLDDIKVRGKIVLCRMGGSNTSIEKGEVVRKAGGVGMILMNPKKRMFTPSARAHVLPAAHVSYAAGTSIKAYAKSSPVPTATIIFKGTRYGTPSPTVASFSGRGPSAINNGILKPDVIGPGVNILAAWPFGVGPNPINISSHTFNMISGTSMSTPHLAGIAALIKASHQGWSPAAIKSAIMTSSVTLSNIGKPIADETLNTANYFATGAGHVHPSKANDPGLVYDIAIDDYTAYLCGLGYTDQQVSAITRRPIACLGVKTIVAEELNYPTFIVSIASQSQKTITRTVTNVGEDDEEYSVQVNAPEGVDVSVYPDKLRFSKVNETAVYDVYFTTGDTSEITGKATEGELRWVSSKHEVRSSVSVMFT